MVGNFNLNRLDFEQNEKVQNFLKIMFSYSIIPVINKPTSVTKNTAITIGHIFINSATTKRLERRIIKFNIYRSYIDIFSNIICGRLQY